MSNTGQKSGVELLAEAYRDAAERELRDEVARLRGELRDARTGIIVGRVVLLLVAAFAGYLTQELWGWIP